MKEKSELEIELEQTIDFLRKRMSEYEFEYNKKLRDIKFLEEENKKLKEKLNKREQGEYRYFGNDGKQDIYEITSIKDGPITYRKDSTGKWVADGEPPYVLC